MNQGTITSVFERTTERTFLLIGFQSRQIVITPMVIAGHLGKKHDFRSGFRNKIYRLSKKLNLLTNLESLYHLQMNVGTYIKKHRNIT